MKAPYIELKFEKVNSKYNRIWEQVTNISLFVLTAFVAYIIALMTRVENIDTQLTIDYANYILLVIAFLVAIVYTILVVHLVKARNEIKKIFEEKIQ